MDACIRHDTNAEYTWKVGTYVLTKADQWSSEPRVQSSQVIRVRGKIAPELYADINRLAR